MITNKTTGKILAKSSRICKGFLCKLVGLMFSKERPGFGIVFLFDRDTSISIHTFFVFHPIDILFLDSNSRVVEIVEKLKPFRVCFPGRAVRAVVELPAGSVERTKTREGHTIIFK